jgi:TPR repeat protein
MKCPFCNSDRGNKPGEDCVEEITERAKANDAASICALARYYNDGVGGVQPDQTKAIELYGRAANLGNKEAHCHLAYIYHEGGDFKKAKFHYVAAAMAGHELARSNLGSIEGQSDIERALKHLSIAASAGEYGAMYSLILFFKKGVISRESINSTLAAYNNSCVEMRSEARDACIQFALETV